MKKTIEITLLVLAGSFFMVSGAIADGDAPDRPEIERAHLPDEVREQFAAYKAERNALRTELRERIAEAGAETDEERHAVVDAFREEFADQIAANRELGADIRAAIAEIRDGRDIPDGVRDRVRQFRQDRADLQAERREFVASLEGLTEEEREAAIQEFREDYRQRLHDLKEERRQLRDRVHENLDGDRRPDE